MWETLHNNAGWDCFRTLTLLDILKTQNRPQVIFFCIFGSRPFVPIGWMCKKQTSVSHSPTEFEIISLDSGLRMDGIPALALWDWLLKCYILLPTSQENPKRMFREPAA